MKKALITGIAGQDGYYMAEFLLHKGYKVYGIDRSPGPADIPAGVEHLYAADITATALVSRIIRDTAPDEIYHLAAFHFSSQHEGNKRMPFRQFYMVNLLAPSGMLETIRQYLPGCRFFYASSCQIFGRPDRFPQDEQTPYQPDSLYGITKAAGTSLCRFYREHHGIFASAGILYNHESPRRPAAFVTTQIAEAAARASLGKPARLVLKDPDALVDWGAAKDYVEAMWLALQQSHGDEFIISSGEPHRVNDFVKAAFGFVGLDPSDFVFRDPDIVPGTKVPYVGDNTKISTQCGWQPSVSFEALVTEMVRDRLTKLSKPQT